MIKYYVYQDGEYDCNDSMKSLQDTYDVNDIILLPEKSYILRIPFIQKYKGLALAISSSILLNKKIDIESFDFNDVFAISNNERNIFILDCSNEYASSNLDKKSMIISPMKNSDVSKLNVISLEFDEYIDYKQESTPVFLGQIKNESSVDKWFWNKA